ncbi:MAG: ribosome small subunit-dependent GTPase A [Lachnospiraceae bacterium]|nr:ribosome small subunit-dependent GTPase A [Lachnospiraceae bacterium]
MEGKIIKGIAGFYYVHTGFGELYECKAKGVFRNKKIKPLVGDRVAIEILDSEKKIGNITEIAERKNSLIRPAVANIDQVIVIFACAQPSPNLNLLDRFLIHMEQRRVETVICFNKCDLITQEEQEKIAALYKKQYPVFFISAKQQIGLEQLQNQMEHKTTVFAGPSGVGKSTTINWVNPEANMETGQISKKIERGKHTTRHSELFVLSEDTFLMDTPGFTSLYLTDIEKEELRYYFPEFSVFEGSCRFQGCMHVNEPNCMVKKAVEDGEIPKERYDNYLQFYKEIQEKKKTYK